MYESWLAWIHNKENKASKRSLEFKLEKKILGILMGGKLKRMTGNSNITINHDQNIYAYRTEASNLKPPLKRIHMIIGLKPVT